MNKLEQNKKLIELLRKEKNELEHEFNVLRYRNGKLEERLINKDRDDFTSDSEYYEFGLEQNKIFDEYYENNTRMKEKEAKINDNNELIHRVGRYDRVIRKAGQYNIDATSNRIAENSANLNKEVSVSDHVKSAENVNSYYQSIFGIPIYITGF